MIVMALIMIQGCNAKDPFVKKHIITPVINVSQVNPRISTAQIKQIIMQCCAARGWRVMESSPTNVVATIAHNRESATVNIVYSKESIEIQYKSSNNLRYDGANIHRGYNRWVRNLEVDIQNKIAIS